MSHDVFQGTLPVACPTSEIALHSFFGRLVRRAFAVARLVRRRRRHSAELRLLMTLDAATLRDLGWDRSEVQSIHAESVGRSARTRRRVA